MGSIGSRNLEVGIKERRWEGKKMRRWEEFEFGSRNAGVGKKECGKLRR